jgi:predicted 3-demethylubiquinone-9 3-methyltransferase (glyoxalase superfamily)
VRFYVSAFPNSKIVSLVRSEADGPIPKGKALSATFRLFGREFTAFDGGPAFSFSIGMSLMVLCRTQTEIDRLWETLSRGGEKGPCGWLTDRFGVSWQIVPVALGEMLSDPKHGNSEAVMDAMLKMKKLDIETLRRAYHTR